MKTHLPTGLRKALIAAIFAVSAVAYNAQAATEYTEDKELGVIDTTTPGTPSYDRQVSIRNGAEITVAGGVTVNGLLVSEGATLDSASTVRSDNDGSTPGVIGVTTNSKIDVEHGSIISGSSVVVSDHGTVIVQDGGLSTGYHSASPANGVLILDDHSKVSVTNGDIDLHADMMVNDRSELTQKDGHLTIEDGDMVITNHSHVTVKNGNLTIGGKTEDIGGGLEKIKSGALTIDGTDNVHDVYLKVTSGKDANGNVQALVVGVNKADLIVGGDLTATVGAVYLNEADTTIGGNVLTNSGLAVAEGTLKAGDVTVTNEWLLKQAGKIIEEASGHGHDTQVAILNGASEMMAERILGVELEDVSEATVGHVDSAGSIIVTESTLKAESLVANDTVAEAIYNKISDTISEAVADEVKLPTSNIVLVGSDVTVTGEVAAADSILVEGEVTLPDDTKVVKGFLNAGGDVTAGGTLKVHKADLTAANVNADCGVIIEGAPKVEVDGVMQDNRNTIVTGDITVENVTATADAVATIIEAKAQVGGTGIFTDDEEALAALAARKDELQQSLGDVSIENVRKSTVGDVTTNGDIVIKGSKLTADSLTADATDVREALTTIIKNKFGTAGVDALADALPTVSITVEDSKVNVKGKVTSDTTISVTNGSLLATGDVTANDGDITAENADLASADMTAEHGAISVDGGSLNAKGDVTADAGLTVSGNEEGTSTLTAGAISVVNNDAIADTKDTIAEISDKIGTIVDGDIFTKDAAITALQAESLDLAGVTIIDMAEGSAVGAVSTNGSIKIFGSTVQADSLTADSTEVREDIINTIKANAKLGGAEAVEKLENLQPAQSSIRVVGSDVMVTGDVYSETGIEVHGGDNGASLLAAGTVTAADGSINAYEADLASGDMTVEHGRVVVLGGSLDATGDVKADAGLLLTGNEEGTSSLNAASITVANKDLIAATQDTIKEIKADSSILDKKAAVAGEIAGLSMLMGVDVQGVTSGTVGDVDVVGDVTIAGSKLTTGSLTADASSLREAIAGTIEEQLGTELAEQMEEAMPVAKITVTESALTVEGDVTSESTIETTDSTVKVAGDVTAAETITVNGGKLIAEGTVSAPEDVAVNAATLQALTIEAETLTITDATSKVKVVDTITADIKGADGTITSTGTEGNGLTIIGNVDSENVTIKTPQGGDIVIGDVTNTVTGVGNITGKQNELTVKGDGDISVMGDIKGAENALKVTGNGGISVNGTISGDGNTLNTQGEGLIYVNEIADTKDTKVTAADGDITIDTLGNNTALKVKSKKGGVTLTNDATATLTAATITAKKDITIGDAETSTPNELTLTDGTTVTSTKGDITLNQTIVADGEGAAITATEGKVTFTELGNKVTNGAIVTAGDSIELAEGSILQLGENTAAALQGGLSGKGTIIAGSDDLKREFDDTAFNGIINMSGVHTLTIADKGVGADATIALKSTGTTLDVTSTGASLGNVIAGATGSVVTINAGAIDDTTTTASTLEMGEGSTLNIDASAESADLITVTKGIAMGAHTVHVTAQESLEAIEGDVTHTIIKLADGAVNEVTSEEVEYDLVDGQRTLQGKNMSLVNAGDHVDLVISTNYRGTENAKPNQAAVNTTLKELSAAVPHNPGALADMPSDLAHVLDALDNTRSEGATLGALQSLSAAGNLVVTNMMMDSTRSHLSTLRSHMGAPTCNGTVTGGNMWAAYTGGHDFIGSDEYTGKYTRTHQGAIIGTDCSLSCNASVGISLGYESATGHQDSTRAEADTMFADLYTTIKTGALTHRFSAGVALHDIDTKRHTAVSAAGHTYTGNSTGSMDAITWNLGYELSYDVKLGSADTLTPFAAVDVAIHQMDTLCEKGQGDASVITEYDEPVQVDVALGAAYTHTFASGAALSASAAVHAELSEKQPEATNHFVGVGHKWTTKSAERTPIYGEIGASVVLPVTASTSLIGGGNFEFSADRTSVGGNVGVNVKF